MEQLKPCPFCGGKVSIGRITAGLPGDFVELWNIHGGPNEGECNCRMFMESNIFWPDENDGAKEKEELIQKWNTRAETNNILQRLEEIAWEYESFGYEDSKVVDLVDAIEIVKKGGKE